MYVSTKTRWATLGSAAAMCLAMTATVQAGAPTTEQALFEFGDRADQERWWSIDDGVMGGRSQGAPAVDARAGVLHFSGTLSLENNGGFSSIRGSSPEVDLSDFDGIVVRFRGDGRDYKFVASTDYRIRAGYYETPLKTTAGQWQTVRLPFESFVATSYGRPLRRAPVLNRRQVSSIGIVLADKNPGSFHLQVDSIKAYRHARSKDDLVSVAVAAGSFKTLARALAAADLVTALRGQGPFTVFAPTDEAFAKLPAKTLNELLQPENRAALTAILTYHVVPGRVTAAQLGTLTRTRTLSGKSATVRSERGALRVAGATVVKADIGASNGVIHVVDTVLMPPEDATSSSASAPRRARELIELAIERGVPEFNSGNSAACASIYEVAARALLALSPDLPDEQRWHRVAARLETLHSERDQTRKAWALRRLLDDSYRALTQ